ncbi:cysteinyl-tRNA synthetase [Aspergillus pseudotamarii]|uniref:cysteine--tRNA ligase n=1 Tax=Aspergillus pseudotamarii TaxID=132259 RepID=A0A5N6T062_ASPPS|nr:cysteinyl-tRNA synthetase [Aspergillus pseudotamarii]KAE8139113.1 cysteinyl-tRNA synthetase [Aspergillus pseudotamarii]
MDSRKQPPWRQPQAHRDTNLPPLTVWNSLTRSKTPFVTLDPKGRKVTWYACGPTVYDDAHLGHARNYVSTDIIRRILKDYFKFDVEFVINITDVDDKTSVWIIVRGRQQHLFSEFLASHPDVNPDVLKTTQLAYYAYIKKNLQLINEGTKPEDFGTEAERVYGGVLKGEALEGNRKPGDREAKVRMHVRTITIAAAMISRIAKMFNQGPVEQPESLENEVITSEDFYEATQDVILPYLDQLRGSTVPGDAYEIFTKLTKKYEEHFMRDMRDLNVLDPDEITRVTEYGQEIADFVERIVANNFGYVTPDGSVYFDIKSFEEAGHPYARLEPWNRNNQPLQRDGEGTLSHAVEKRSPDDFALWKASRPGEPSWKSQWGPGRPGWHIECSAMASSRLGSQIDIHSGGIDLAFPHHDNELAQSEAFWSEKKQQWVNYFLHMGHLSIQGSKMSKSLKNFTTVRSALDKGDWTPRSLRIVFLLGGWRDGVEITPELIQTASVWEDKLNNFFVKVKDPSGPGATTDITSDPNISLAQALATTKAKAHQYFCDSFDTPKVMRVISELVSTFNNVDQNANLNEVQDLAQWVTRIVTILGLNGKVSPESCGIGWEGTDIPEPAKPFLYPLSTMRDALREAAKSQSEVTHRQLKAITGQTPVDESLVSQASRSYFQVFKDFRARISPSNSEDTAKSSKELLSLCDRLRDVELFDLGIYLEDRENKPALVRPVTRDLLQSREEQTRKMLLKQQEKEKQEKLAKERLEKGRLSHLDMFRTSEYSAWDEDGMPTKDAAGEPINKSRSKKLRRDWERQKKAHETWIASQSTGS